MATERIDFISAYCDRWCERCAFAERCSSFAVHAAVAMCDGDFEAALELAVGRPQSVHGQEAPSIGERMFEESNDLSIDDKEMEEVSRELDAEDKRVGASPISRAASDYGIGAWRWLEERRQSTDHPDPDVREAIETIGWDAHLIGAKLHRALAGHDAFINGNRFADDRVQNDWNGSAKVALISIERSLRAWGVVHLAFVDAGSAALRDQLQALAADVRAQFPNALRFRRPGFDAGEKRHPPH